MGFELRQCPSRLETINKFKDWMESAIEEAKSMIWKAQENMAWYYNQKRILAPVFHPRDSVPWCIRHQDYTSFCKTVTLQTQTFCSRMSSRTPGLLIKAASHNEETLSYIQCGEALHHSGWPNSRMKARTSTTLCHHRWKRGMKSRGDTQ